MDGRRKLAEAEILAHLAPLRVIYGYRVPCGAQFMRRTLMLRKQVSRLDGEITQVDDGLGDRDFSRTPLLAGAAGGAEPEGGIGEHLIAETQEGTTDELAGAEGCTAS